MPTYSIIVYPNIFGFRYCLAYAKEWDEVSWILDANRDGDGTATSAASFQNTSDTCTNSYTSKKNKLPSTDDDTSLYPTLCYSSMGKELPRVEFY